ncbi:MAG: hypothetical protein ABIE74_02515 [Pseudomonadota bacterium]
MKNKMLFWLVLMVFGIGFTSCGGGSSSSSTDEATASVKSLSSVPSIDLSSYDNSTSASANVAVLNSVSKGLGENLTEVGKSSRAGCEANMHKKEMIRMSQMSQLERCYPEAMEGIGLITIPEGSYAYYNIKPPEENNEQKGKMCDGIPDEDAERKAACMGEGEGGGGKGGGSMKMRIGIIDGDLQIDMCEGRTGAEVLVNEATYAASGSVYTADVIHIGQWGGQTERNSLNVIVDLGADGSVTNGLVNLGTAGTALATGNMSGGFGDGVMSFEAIASDSSNRVSGAFAGSFVDPFTGTASSFTGKVYSRFGGAAATGCAKFSFGGSQPPMRVADMVPFDIPQNDLDNFLQAFGADLGIDIDSTNYQNIYLCENPNFDWENPDPTIKPMIALTGGETCGVITHTGLECFGISNIIRSGDFGNEVSQGYTIIATSGSPYFDEVNAYDISGLSAAITTPAFSRAWDCSGTFESLDFENLFQTLGAEAIEAAMRPCQELEEKAFGNEGMGGYDCGKQQQMNGVNDFAEGGGNVGTFDAEYGFKEDGTNTCVPNTIPGRLFVDVIDATANTYCVASEGNCRSFDVVGTNAVIPTPLAYGFGNVNLTITAISYDDAVNPTTASFTFAGAIAPCTQVYFIEKHNFSAPQEFGGGGPMTPPAPCVKADGSFVPEDVCHQICSDPSVDCRV